MSSKSIHKGKDGSITGILNGTANGSSNSTVNGNATMKLTSEEPSSRTQKALLQNTSVPKGPGSSKFLRTALLLLYFWTCVYVLAITQYIGAPLYLIKKDYYYRYMTFTKQGMALLILSMTQWWTKTELHISGDESVKDQIRTLPDGRVECRFADRLVLIANHQMYNDWVYLWWTAYTASFHGSVYIVLKDSIKYIPVIGFGLRMAGFVFMSRKMKTDQPRLTHRLAQLTRKDSASQRAPMWLLMFPEGTNLSKNGRAASVKWAKRKDIPDLEFQLIPRSTGTYFCLKGLNGTVRWVYDCTLAYDGVPEGQYGQDIFTLRSTYVEGHPPPIHMHWRRFAVSSIPLSTLEEFDVWLQERWGEKEKLLKEHARTGSFPSALDQGKSIETEVKVGHWTELLKFCGVLVLQFACVGFILYGGKKAV